MNKNIFVTGPPGCGKTTLIKEIIGELNLNAGGFHTEEIREAGVRKGFRICSLNGESGVLASVNFKSTYKVGKYGVNMDDLEKIGVNAILTALKENKIVVIDEIGRMELLSRNFREAVDKVINSRNNVLGTVKLKPCPFTDRIKNRPDTKTFDLSRETYPAVKAAIMELHQQSW